MTDVKELFETFDADGSGRISTQEVAGLLTKLGAPKPAAAVAALVAQVDTDGDGEVSYAEFEAMLRSQADLAHIVQDKRQAIKQLHVRQGAGNSQHSFSSEEAEAFTEVLNSRLGGDAALAAVLPLAQDAADPPLFAACADAITKRLAEFNAQDLANTLYGRRFFPYYTWNVLAGLDQEGVGVVYTYDPVGNYERVRVSVTGSGESLIQPLLDNQLERQHQSLGAKPPPLHIDLELADAVDLVKDAFVSAGERDIKTGDSVEICIITKEGVRIETHPLNID